ncbi:hypothetical protein MCG98_16595 [Ruminococcus sp. OA3]|uniref:cysteine-rich small domain-containing protein n=1 Tax=Ruminococcus sp. OA3 TaxID=2914164 RepID=UPI001F062948|nr:cysteine-rich small domain-containing protein [Ruminococcus sp. OA3]MCH1984187.1 hypothetical protein [Ruminococcus sp. OA3]
MFYSDNPALDAEKEAERQEELAERPHIECDWCHGYIYECDDWHDGDFKTKLNGLIICDDCLSDYIKSIRKEHTG